MCTLQTQQENAVGFHSFATAFCAVHNQPPPPALRLPDLASPPLLSLEEIERENVEARNNVTQADDDRTLDEKVVQEADDPSASHDETPN